MARGFVNFAAGDPQKTRGRPATDSCLSCLSCSTKRPGFAAGGLARRDPLEEGEPVERDAFQEALLRIMEAKTHWAWPAFTSGQVRKDRLHIHLEQEFGVYI